MGKEDATRLVKTYIKHNAINLSALVSGGAPMWTHIDRLMRGGITDSGKHSSILVSKDYVILLSSYIIGTKRSWKTHHSLR